MDALTLTVFALSPLLAAGGTWLVCWGNRRRKIWQALRGLDDELAALINDRNQGDPS